VFQAWTLSFEDTYALSTAIAERVATTIFLIAFLQMDEKTI
jgi:hypothetical protein